MEYLLLLFIIIIGYVITFNKLSITNILTDPFSFMVMMFVFIHVFSPLMKEYLNLEGLYGELDISDYNSSGKVLLYLTTSFIFLSLGYFCKPIGAKRKLSINELYMFKDKYIKLILYIYLLGCAVFLTTFLPLLLANPALFLSDRINQFSGHGYLLLTTNLSTLLVIVLFYKYMYKKEKRYLIWLVVVFVTMVAVALIMGSRTSIVLPFILIGLIKLFFERTKINFKKIFKVTVLFVFLFTAIALLGNVRKNVQTDSTNHSGKSVVETVIGELVLSFSHTELLHKITTMNLKYELGNTYLATIVLPVPRSLWPEKPVGGGPILKNIVAPGSYDLVSNDFNSSLTTGLFLEAYLNFGFWGAIIIPFFYGFLFAGLLKIFYKETSIYRRYAISLFLILMILSFPSGEFLGVFVRVLGLVFPLLLIDFVERLRVMKKYNRE